MKYMGFPYVGSIDESFCKSASYMSLVDVVSSPELFAVMVSAMNAVTLLTAQILRI